MGTVHTDPNPNLACDRVQSHTKWMPQTLNRRRTVTLTLTLLLKPLPKWPKLGSGGALNFPLTPCDNGTIRRQTNSRSVKSRTGQIADWITCGLGSSWTGQLAGMFDAKVRQSKGSKFYIYKYAVSELTSPRVIQSASWPVGDLTVHRVGLSANHLVT